MVIEVPPVVHQEGVRWEIALSPSIRACRLLTSTMSLAAGRPPGTAYLPASRSSACLIGHNWTLQDCWTRVTMLSHLFSDDSHLADRWLTQASHVMKTVKLVCV